MFFSLQNISAGRVAHKSFRNEQNEKPSKLMCLGAGSGLDQDTLETSRLKIFFVQQVETININIKIKYLVFKCTSDFNVDFLI